MKVPSSPNIPPITAARLAAAAESSARVNIVRPGRDEPISVTLISFNGARSLVMYSSGNQCHIKTRQIVSILNERDPLWGHPGFKPSRRE